MSEKMYALLFRLYPRHFREAYREEALQLFRDRLRDERGVFASIRLWLDLLVDLMRSIPKTHLHPQVAFARASAAQPVAAGPSFPVLEFERLRPGHFVLAAIVSLAALAATAKIVQNAGRTQGVSVSRSMPAGRMRPSGSAGRLDHQSGATTTMANAAPAASPVKAQQVTDAQNVPGTGTLTPAERHRVLDAVIANLKQHYISPEVAEKAVVSLQAHQQRGDYDRVTDGASFAHLLTQHTVEASGDRHLIVDYSQARLPNQPAEPTREALAGYRAAMEQDNCTFESVQMLPGKVGYFKLNSFPDPSICGSKARDAMVSLNNAQAIIFDLRDNRAGYEEMVSLIAAYLFDHPEYMYSPRQSTSTRSWTQSPVPGSRLSDKPVYVLTSRATISAAEQFSYDLKMLKRATLVGETTRGGAHAGVFHRIDDHFGIGVTEVKSVNPFGQSDWEGTGVEPDVKVKAADALKTAQRLAMNKTGN